MDVHNAGRHTTGEMAELFNVSRATVYRYLSDGVQLSA